MNTYQAIRTMWSHFSIDSVQALNMYLDNFRILFAYHSGKIENDEITYHDTREIFENGKILNFTGNPRSIMEQQNQKLCYDFLKEKIISKKPMTVQLVLEIHRILASGTYDEKRYVEKEERPGEFKKHDYITGIMEVGSLPENVAEDIRELLNEINDYHGDDVLQSAAYFHLKFEHIHPFADGNGRVGRTLLNYYLLTRSEPPLIIYDEDKNQYYKALVLYDSEEQISPMYCFLVTETEKTWKATLLRLRNETETPGL